jgi:hypothetical protein
VFLVDWTASGGRRVALLPDPGRLALSALLGTGLVAAVWLLAGSRLRPSIPRGDAEERARVAAGRLRAALAPLLLLWLWSVPYLPVLADQFPSLLTLAGGARWLVAALAAAGVIWAVWGDAIARWEPWRDTRPAWLFAIALAVYAGVGTYVNRAQGYGGDEPHYLIIAESLLKDGDLRIENNHEQGDYRAFFPGTLAPHFIRRGLDGVIYSIHAPGLPAMALPAYALAGAAGVRLLIGVFAALAGVAVYRLCRATTGSGPALVAWLVALFATPLVFHGWLIFPETPAAALVAWAAWWAWADLPPRARVWGWRGLLLALFPWLHAKFAVLLACFLAAFAVRLAWRRAWASLAWLAVPSAAGLVLWFYAFLVMYGVADPTIVYGGPGAMTYELQWSNVPRGLLGFAFDQEYGVWLHAPAYLLAVPGFWWMLRDRHARGLGALAAIVVTVFLVSTTRYYMWWGGSSVPGRFLVPVVPIFALAVAVGLSRLAAARARGVAALLVIATLGVSLTLTARPGRYLMFNNRDGRGNLVDWLQGDWRLDASLPSLLWVDWPAQLPAVATIVVGLLAAVAVTRLRRVQGPAGTMTPYWAATAFLLTFSVTMAVVTDLRASSASLHDGIRDGRLAWLQRSGDGRPAVDPTSFSRARWQDALTDGLLFLAPSEPTEDASRAIGPMTLPPGRYRAAAWFRPNLAGEGDLRLAFDPGRTPLATATTRGLTPVAFSFEVPHEVAAPPLWLGASSLALAQGLARVQIVPIEIVGVRSRADVRAVAIDPVPGRSGAFLAYLDRGAYDEGGEFWTHGGRDASLMVFPGGATVLRIWCRAGAAGGDATLSVAGITHRWTLAPDQGEAVVLPLLPGTKTVPLHVSFSGAFRPADVDPSSRDRRLLGLRVGVGVE